MRRSHHHDTTHTVRSGDRIGVGVAFRGAGAGGDVPLRGAGVGEWQMT
jgi:hypothetical protein